MLGNVSGRAQVLWQVGRLGVPYRNPSKSAGIFSTQIPGRILRIATIHWGSTMCRVLYICFLDYPWSWISNIFLWHWSPVWRLDRPISITWGVPCIVWKIPFHMADPHFDELELVWLPPFPHFLPGFLISQLRCSRVEGSWKKEETIWILSR